MTGRSHPPLDFRLAPAAAAVWGATLFGLGCGGAWAWVLAAVAAVIAVVSWRVRYARCWANGALVVCGFVIVAAVATAVRMSALAEHPVRNAAEHGQSVTATVELVQAPRPLRGASYGAVRAEDRALIRTTLVHATLGGRSYRLGGELTLFAATEPWRGVSPGQTVTVRGKLLPARAPSFEVAAMRVNGAPIDPVPAPGWQRVAETLREGLRRAAADTLDPTAAGLLPGLVIGDTGGLANTVIEDFEAAGMTHLTAVSGANLAIVCGAVLLAARALGAGPIGCTCAAAFALVGFVILTGPEPSVLRAAVMGAVGLVALVLGRERSALPALSASVLGLVLLCPELAVSAGFALSVAATAGLVLLAPGWAAALRERGVPRGLAEALAVPTAAHLVTAPLVVMLSGTVSLVAVFANLLADPLVAPATVLGVLATVLAPMWSAGANLLVAGSGPELQWILVVAHRAATFPIATVPWPSGIGGAAALAVLTTVLVMLLRSRRIRWVGAVAVLLAGVVLVPMRTLSPGWPVPGWSMVACDVGQGDGMVLSTGRAGEAVVVDTGPESTHSSDCLRGLGIQRVPLVLLTHLHADHVGGLAAVLRDREVGGIGVGGLHQPSWAMREVVGEARNQHVPVLPLRAGTTMNWPGLRLEVIGPVGSLTRARQAEQANDASLVVRATTPAGRILLTGDIELQGQSELLASGQDVRAEVLKVPHHGSRYTTPRLLAAVRPRVAIISVGDGNSYGHPSPMVVGALTRLGTRVLRTDQQGSVAVLPGEAGPRTASRGSPLRDGGRR